MTSEQVTNGWLTRSGELCYNLPSRYRRIAISGGLVAQKNSVG